jgi:hypothetical protein
MNPAARQVMKVLLESLGIGAGIVGTEHWFK